MAHYLLLYSMSLSSIEKLLLHYPLSKKKINGFLILEALYRFLIANYIVNYIVECSRLQFCAINDYISDIYT